MTRQELYQMIYDKVVSFKTESIYGFTNDEMVELLKDFKNINIKKFNDAMMGNTCMVENEKIINYPCDVEYAIRCGIENRDLYESEFD